MNADINFYNADPEIKHPSFVVREMISGIFGGWYVAYRLFLKDIRGEYSRSLFGFLWDFMDPLVLATVFYLLMQARVINRGDITIPYAVFVIYGVLIFQTFCDAVLIPLDLMSRSKVMLINLKLSPEALLLSVLYRLCFNSFFRIIVMLIFSLALDAFSFVGFMKFLLCFPTIMLAGMSIGVFAAPFHTIYSDIGKIIRILLTPLRYATPVLFAIPNDYPYFYINYINPISLILMNLRSLATENLFDNYLGFALRCVFFVCLFLLGWFSFHVSIPILAGRA